MKVLIVDDNDQSLYLLRTVLEHAGHEVWPASDGAEALALAGKNQPDALISDILMPRLDGFALCRAVRQSERLSNLPVILYSATYTDAKDRELGLAVGADRFLEKPMEPEDLLRELESAVEERKSGRPRHADAALEERTFLREYNERLVRKLEDKMLDLERAYRELSDSERRYHELFDVASDVIFRLSSTGEVTLVNRRIQEILGLHPAETMNRSFTSLVAPSQRTRAQEALQQALDGQRLTIDLDFLSSDGRTIPMHVMAVPLWQGQRPSGIMGIARDMSERAKLEATRLDDARRRGTDEGFREMVDEIEGPLAGVLAGFRELMNRPGIDGDIHGRVTALESQCRKLSELLRRGPSRVGSPDA
ncbi:MAG: response regulator [Candidatus Eiseniibacteriota bacterium]